MKVVCDNCRAVYKVPDDKLTKAVNKATCRNCSHRMLIPRPKPNADPEERTLVTAVPPTPPGAPPRAGMEHGHRSSGPDDLNMGTPMVAPRVDQTISEPDGESEGPDTKLSLRGSGDPQRDQGGRGPRSRPSEQITAREAQPRVGRSTPPPSGRGAPSRQPPAPISGGNAGQRRSQPPPSHETPASSPRLVAPGPRNTSYPSMALHDPASDLNWVLFGTGTALVGACLLAFLSPWNHPLVMWFGLAMTFGGGLLTFMVLLTGGRGRRPAKVLLSLVLGFLVALVMSSTMVATKWGAEQVFDAYDIHFSNVGLTAGSSVPTAPGNSLSIGTIAPIELPEAEPGLAAATPPRAEEGRTPSPAKVPKAPSVPAPATPPAPPRVAEAKPPPAPAPNLVPPPAPSAVADPAPAPTPAPAPAPEGMATVPLQVIDVMLSNNLEVKKCFVPLFKAGSLPPRVDLKFNVMPAGNATSIQLLQPQFQGTELESCLVRAVGNITFPPTTGSGTSITYPFVLQ